MKTGWWIRERSSGLAGRVDDVEESDDDDVKHDVRDGVDD